MFYAILLVVFTLLFAWMLIKMYKKLHPLGLQRVGYIATCLFAVFGFLVGGIILSLSLSPNTLFPRMGHFIISTFSLRDATIGRLTLLKDGEEYTVFPGNREEKIVEIYQDGSLFTGELSNGRVKVLQDTEIKLSLPWVFFGK